MMMVLSSLLKLSRSSEPVKFDDDDKVGNSGPSPTAELLHYNLKTKDFSDVES